MAGFGVGDRDRRLLDADHFARARCEREREQAAAAVEVGDDVGGLRREHLLHEPDQFSSRMRRGLEERGRRDAVVDAADLFVDAVGARDVHRLCSEQSTLGAVVVVAADGRGTRGDEILRDAFDLGQVEARDDDDVALASALGGAHEHAAQQAAVLDGIPRVDAQVGEQLDRAAREPQRLVRCCGAFDERDQLQFAQRVQRRDHAAPVVGQDLQRDLVAHSIRFAVPHRRRDRGRMFAERPAKVLLDARLLEAQLRRVVDVLPMAATAREEVATLRLDAFLCALVDVGDARAAELARRARDLGTDAFARQRAGHQHDVALDVRERVGAVGQGFDLQSHAIAAAHGSWQVGAAHGGAGE